MMSDRSNPAFNRELAQAEADVERARERVASSISALHDGVSRQADWRGWLTRHPVISLGGALAIGFWLGGRRRPHLEIGGRR
jgi:hypothetical protein